MIQTGVGRHSGSIVSKEVADWNPGLFRSTYSGAGFRPVRPLAAVDCHFVTVVLLNYCARIGSGVAAAAALKVAPFMACSGFFLWDRLGGVGLPSLDSSSLILQSGQQSRCFSHPIHS
jgi:hypothetical protein